MRDSPERDIWFVHVVLLGSCQDVAAAAAAVIWKMPKYEEMHTFSKMGMSEISRNVYLSEIKAPAGAS